MKPRFEISKQNNFTVWESGALNPKKCEGWAVIVAGPEGGRPPVIYDMNVCMYSLDHALFFARAGMLVATCKFVSVGAGKEVKATFELQRIMALSRLPDNSVLAEMTKLWSVEMICIHDEIKDRLATYYNQSKDTSPAILNILNLAYEKATTPRSLQKLFWGVPRLKKNRPNVGMASNDWNNGMKASA